MLRFNHMEITLPLGTVERDGENLTSFMKEVFGFELATFPAPLEHPSLVYASGEDGHQFLFLAEHPEPLARASEDHLGLHVDTACEVDRMQAACTAWQARDPRVEIRDFGKVDFGQWETRAFYVRYILPIWFDVQNIASKEER